MVDFAEGLVQIIVFSSAGWLHGIFGMGFPLITAAMIAASQGLPPAIILMLFPSLTLHLLWWDIGGEKRGVEQGGGAEPCRYGLLALGSVLGLLLGKRVQRLLPPARFRQIILVLLVLLGLLVDWQSVASMVASL